MTKNHQVPNVSSAEAEKPWLKGWKEEDKPAEESKSTQESVAWGRDESKVSVSSGMKTEDGRGLTGGDFGWP